MNEAEIRAIALFFYVSLLDDRKAVEAAIDAAAIAREKIKRSPDVKTPSLIVAATSKVWEATQKRLDRTRTNLSADSGWLLPDGLDLGPWREFQKNATSDELLVVIWARILGFGVSDVAEGLELSEGTVRYRLGRALRKLGGMTSLRPKLF
jgi:DNA-binding NarL/FixJ family response regulator